MKALCFARQWRASVRLAQRFLELTGCRFALEGVVPLASFAQQQIVRAAESRLQQSTAVRDKFVADFDVQMEVRPNC